MAGETAAYTSVRTAHEDQQEPEPRRQRRSFSHWLYDSWLVEIVCTAFGIMLIVALCLVLNSYDGKPQPHFGSALGSAVTLNTIVAIISTFAKAALMLPVAECISQLKWAHFEKGYHRLSDMNTFDHASRGIWGSLVLVWKTRLMYVWVLIFMRCGLPRQQLCFHWRLTHAPRHCP